MKTSKDFRHALFMFCTSLLIIISLGGVLTSGGGCQQIGQILGLGPPTTQQTGDPVVLGMENLTQTSVNTINTFLTVDSENRTFMIEHLPQLHAVAESLRRDAPDVIRQVRSLTKAYKQSRSKPDSDSLNVAMDRLQDLVRLARQASTKFDSAKREHERATTVPS